MSQHVECHRCGYGWDYTGNSEYYASCPKCKTSVPLVEDENATTASADASATQASNERVDELRGRVKELEETAGQLQSAIEEMTKKVTEIEHRKRRETRADAPEPQAEADAAPEPETDAAPDPDDGIRVAVESDPGADAGEPRAQGAGDPGDGDDRQDATRSGVGAARRGDDIPPSRGQEPGQPGPDGDEPAGTPRSGPSEGRRDPGTGAEANGSVGGRDAGRPDRGRGTTGDGFGDGERREPRSADTRGRDSVERSTDADPTDATVGPSDASVSGGASSGVKPQPDEEGSYDYACPECDGPVSGQPEMCIHCGTSFRWT